MHGNLQELLDAPAPCKQQDGGSPNGRGPCLENFKLKEE